MSDQVWTQENHVWAQENIAAYVVGGLDAAERDRLETHAADCAACGRAIEQTRALERKMALCFTAADPGPALEDRVIQRLPANYRQGTISLMSTKKKFLLTAAACFLLIVVGVSVTAMMNEDFLRFPAAAPASVANNIKQMGLAAARRSEKRSAGETRSMLEGERAYSPESAPAGKSAGELAAELKVDLDKNVRTGWATSDGTVALGIDSFREAQITSNGIPTAPPGWGRGQGGALQIDGAQGNSDANTPNPNFGGIAGGAGGGRGPNSPGQQTNVKDQPAMAGMSMGYANNPYQAPTSLAAPSPYLNLLGTGASTAHSYYNLVPSKPADGLGRTLGNKIFGDKRSEDLKEGLKDLAQATKTEKKSAEQPAEPQPSSRKIIRSGDIEFEVDSFDDSVTIVMRLVSATRGGFVATINSDKLANGKVRGSIVVRVPPEQLDKFVLDLRKELGKHGELKNQRIGSEDISKKYTDTESRLRAARSMEERLLHIIKEGKGSIKEVLQAEKELGKWREQIETMEGELRYWSNLVSLSTLNINLYEKDIRIAAAVTENERVQTGIEVEDVEKAHQDALKAITDFKGRVARSELKQHAAGQFSALLHFEVSPEATGPMRDRLKQLGAMVRLQIDRVQQTPNGAPPPKDGKIERGPTQFIVDLYNLANVAPRETVVLRIASSDVPGEYLKLRELVGKSKGRVINAQLNQNDRQNIGAQLDFDVRRASVGEVQAALSDAGETLSRQVNRIPENDNVTDAKVQYKVALVDAAAIPPRENVTMKIAAGDVPAAYQQLVDALAKAKARVHKADLNEQDRRNITAVLTFDLARSEQTGVLAALAGAGEVLSRQANRQQESVNVTDTRVGFQVDLSPADAIPPRETTLLALEVHDVQGTLAVFTAQVKDAHGKILGSPEIAQSANGQVTGRATFDVPLAAASGLVEGFKLKGQLRVYKMTPNPQAPDGKLALARIDVTVSNAPLLVPSDQGLWSQIRGGLAFSLRGLSISASWLIVGLLFVLPWLLVLYVVVLLARRLFRGVAVADTSPAGPSAPPPAQ